jgi:hypothetical protein
MMEKQRKAYATKRAALLAQLFLQDLGASVWTTAGATDDGPFDSIAAFLTNDQKLRISAIEIKATEQPVVEEYCFQAQRRSIRALQHSNVPVLFLVADVKRNELFYGWASDIRVDSAHNEGKHIVHCTLPVVPAAQKKDELLKTILSQPEFAERVAAG